MEPHKNIKKEGMNSLGKSVSFGLFALIAGFISKKLMQKYPNGEVGNFLKGAFGIFVILFCLILLLLIVFSILYGLYDVFQPEPETAIEKAQRLLREKEK